MKRPLTVLAFFVAGWCASGGVATPQQLDPHDPGRGNAEATISPALLAQWRAQLGAKEDGQFLFVFSKLKGPRKYLQADLANGKEEAVKLLAKFYWHAQQTQHFDRAKCDFRFVGRFEDAQAAEAKRKEMELFCQKNSVIGGANPERERRFFNQGGEIFGALP